MAVVYEIISGGANPDFKVYVVIVHDCDLPVNVKHFCDVQHPCHENESTSGQ